jgi:hypothetical protein
MLTRLSSCLEINFLKQEILLFVHYIKLLIFLDLTKDFLLFMVTMT